VGAIVWGQDIAEIYDRVYAAEAESPVVAPMVDLLVGIAPDGPALEFASGSGRIALSLSARGIPVQGIELSPHMVEQMQTKPGAEAVPVVIGDMSTVRVAGAFALVYVVANSIMNLTTQEEQLAVFMNAAEHLEPGGHFVVELIVPQLRRVPPSETAWVFNLDPDHVGIETYEDVVAQVAWSHHWMAVDERLVHHSAPYRYIWPSELILMAKLAGFDLADRWGDWDRSPFTSESAKQVAVFRKVTIPGEAPTSQ
jgi:SAM-dependent methyltransferase